MWSTLLAVMLPWFAGSQELPEALSRAEALYQEASAAPRGEALTLLAQALDLLDRAAGAELDPGAAYRRWMVALEARRQKDWRLAERAWRAAAVYYETEPGEQDVYLLAAQGGLAEALAKQPDLPKHQESLALLRRILASQLLHHDAHSDPVLQARHDLALSLAELEQLEEAREEWNDIVKTCLQRGDEASLHEARINLCDVYERLGDSAGLERTAVAMDQRAQELFPAGHPQRLRRRTDAVTSLVDAGVLRSARRILFEAREEYRAVAPADALRGGDYQRLVAQLGQILYQERDYVAALAAFDEHFEQAEVWNGDATSQAGWIRIELGDFEGALALLRAQRGDDYSAVTASASYYLGDHRTAREMYEDLCEQRARRFPEEPRRLRDKRYLQAVMRLGAVHLAAGDLDAARERFQETLRSPLRLPLKDQARFQLAWMDSVRDRTPEALTAVDDAFAEARRSAPRPADIREMRHRLVLVTAANGNPERLDGALLDGLRDATTQVESGLFLSDRGRESVLASVRSDIDRALSFGSANNGLLRTMIFDFIESRRAAGQSMTGMEVARQDPGLAELFAQFSVVREQLGETRPVAHPDQASHSTEADRLTARRDRLQREIRSRMTRLGVSSTRLTAVDVAVSLPRGTAALAYYRYGRWEIPDGDALQARSVDHLVAHVVRAGSQEVHRVDLGPAAPIERSVELWRNAIGAPVDRGVNLSSGPEDVDSLGQGLRGAVLDPVLEVVGDGTADLYVCLEDVLHLVPLEALPTGDGVVGDRWRLRIVPSFRSLVRPLEAREKPLSLLVVGGVDFGADPGVAESRELDPAEAPHFESLPFTDDEVVKIADLFRGTTAKEPVVLRGLEASKSAVVDHAESARYVHIATHGWFASPDIRSLADPVGSRLEASGFGASPLSLCGLALTGANEGRDRGGRLPGILTAEHLAGLDLRGCELAVLSACRTNVGLRRGGQSIQSLQTALHAAGTRHAVTSLWRIPDSLTEELMVRFYRNLWERGMAPHDALWEAKTWVRRERGARLQYWAAWVISSQ